MAKARAIVKRRKAVRNIRKITKTMQMIATAKFQKALKAPVGTKPYSRKVRELITELAGSIKTENEPLMRQPTDADRKNRVALLVLTSNRGLAGAYNGTVLRMAGAFVREQEAAGKTVELHLAGKKGITYFNYQRKPIAERYEQFGDMPSFENVDRVAENFMRRFIAGELDAVYVAYMVFQSAGVQKPDVLTLLPLAAVKEKKPGDGTRPGAGVAPTAVKGDTIYDFYPSARSLLDELLPLSVKTSLFQTFLDATTSENVARMVAMKSATDNADKMVKSLTMQYNRARQSQITTELSEIMGGVEAMKG